jgi:hypothetical protein
MLLPAAPRADGSLLAGSTRGLTTLAACRLPLLQAYDVAALKCKGRKVGALLPLACPRCWRLPSLADND